jgi:hypothetical protein
MKAQQFSVVILSSSLLTDRMLRFSGWGESLAQSAITEIWATARTRTSEVSGGGRLFRLLAFPKVGGFREFPHNYLRRLNEYSWDYRLKTSSRLSMIEHVRNRTRRPMIKALRGPGHLLAWAGLHQAFEDRLNRHLLSCSRSPEARDRLKEVRPSLLVATGPHRYEEPAVVAEAMNLGIPVMAMITSWDNLTTKNRMLFNYNAYLVWSEQMKEELHHFYPRSRHVAVHVVGAPQFDVFSQERFSQSREQFCRSQRLDPKKPYILYALGSPNFLKEHHGALAFAEHINSGELGDVQLVVRPHPLFDDGHGTKAFAKLGPRVVVQRTGNSGVPLPSRTQDESQVIEWVNTVRHAGVVVNLSSTIGIDAAICDRPVVNIDFDPEPGQPNQRLVKDVNHVWNHFKPVAESGGLWLAGDMDEVVRATGEYLKAPWLHREKRRWMADYVCGFIDGRCGERAATAMLDFLASDGRARRSSDPALATSL